MTIWRVRIACWVPKAIHTHNIVILIASNLQQWLQELASVLRLYVHCLSCLTTSCVYMYTHRTWGYVWSDSVFQSKPKRASNVFPALHHAVVLE